MTRNRFTTFVGSAAVVALAVLAVTVSAGGASTSAVGVAKSHTVNVRGSSLGKILVNSKGRTLYLFKKDSRRKSACTGACAKAWPPLRANGKPTVGSGASASRVGTIRRSDGKPQVTYKGHPLYLFQGDTKAGDTNGQGLTAFGGSWFALSPAGNQVASHTSAPGGGGGY
jgi:predicted lipoprotein with Yx(FWY)xxD motif